MQFAIVLAEWVVLVGGTVHVTAEGAPPRVASVAIEDGVIRAVGDAPEVPADARRIDVSGLHVVPGLLDGMAYHDAEHDPLYVAAGVTLVRDHGNDLARIFRSARAEERARSGGPWLSISGAVLDGYPPSSSSALVLRDAAQARAYVPTMVGEGVDFLSVQQALGEEVWLEVLKIAHQPPPSETGPDGSVDDSAARAFERLQVWGPCPKGTPLRRAMDAGQDGFLFLDGFLPPGASWDTVDPASFDDLVADVARCGARVTPCLNATARLLLPQVEDDPRLDYLGPQYASVWRTDAGTRAQDLSVDRIERTKRALAAQRALVAALDRAGAVLVPGSGAPHPWLMPGAGLVDELSEWQRAGVSAARCLESATVRAARALDLDGRGVVAPGAVADLIVLGADPEAEIGALRAVQSVVLRGQVLDRATLDGGLERLKRELATARRVASQPIQVEAPLLPEGDVLLRGYVETTGSVGRIAGERWAVVREKDGALSFCGRRVILATAREPSVEVRVRQTARSERLESFEVSLGAGGHELAVRGQLVAGQMRVERRLDGGFVDNRSAREAIAAIDVSSVTTLALLAHFRKEGPLPMLRFDNGLELEVVRWDLALEDDGDQWLRTHNGRSYASFQENGALRVALVWEGPAMTKLESLEIDAGGGAGLPLSEERLSRMRAAHAAEANAKPAPGENAPVQEPPKDAPKGSQSQTPPAPNGGGGGAG